MNESLHAFKHFGESLLLGGASYVLSGGPSSSDTMHMHRYWCDGPLQLSIPESRLGYLDDSSLDVGSLSDT